MLTADTRTEVTVRLTPEITITVRCEGTGMTPELSRAHLIELANVCGLAALQALQARGRNA